MESIFWQALENNGASVDDLMAIPKMFMKKYNELYTSPTATPELKVELLQEMFELIEDNKR